MGVFSTLRDIAGGVAAVAGVIDIFSGDERQGPNPEVATFNWLQSRVNAAEQVRQLGWQAWMAGEQAHQHVAAAAIAFQQQGNLEDAADVQDRMVGYHGAVAGHQRAVSAFQSGEAIRRAEGAVTRGELLTGDLERRYTGVQATYDRTEAMASADRDAARIQAKTAQATAAATITRAEVAIQRATTSARQQVAGLRLSAAQGGLASSSYTGSATAAVNEDLALTLREQNAVKAGAAARAAGAEAQVGITDRRTQAALDFASAQHGIGMGAAAADFTRGQLQLDDLSAQAQQWGFQAAQSNIAAGRSDIAGAQAGVQAGATRIGAEAAGLRGSGQLLGARGQQIQQDFFRTQAQIGTHFLQQQPGVEEYGGQEDILQRMSTRHDPQEETV